MMGCTAQSLSIVVAHLTFVIVVVAVALNLFVFRLRLCLRHSLEEPQKVPIVEPSSLHSDDFVDHRLLQHMSFVSL